MMRVNTGPVLDVMPESYPYRDDGCQASPSCLRCPLPKCKYDDPGGFQRERRRGRDEAVISAMHRQNLSVAEAAARFDISPRTIFRILRREGFREMAVARAA